MAQTTAHTSDSQHRGIILFGANIDTGNLGCSALTVSLIGLLAGTDGETPVSLLYGSRTGGAKSVRIGSVTTDVRIVNYRVSPKSRPGDNIMLALLGAIFYRLIPIRVFRQKVTTLFPVLGAVHDASFIGNIRGGDSFSDIYGMRRFILGNLPNFIAILLGAPYVLLPQTYGPFRSNIARVLAGVVMRHAVQVYARDEDSRALAQSLIGEGSGRNRVQVCPDVAFSLPLTPVDDIAAEPSLPGDEQSVLVGVNVSGLLYRGGYSGDNMFGLAIDYPQCMRQLIETLLDRPECHVLLVPHVIGDSAENDVDACNDVFDQLKGRHPEKLHRLTRTYDQGEIKSVIGTCAFFLGSRMHACIAAISQGIPAAGIAYSKKFAGVFGLAGIESSVVDARTLGETDLIDACLRLYEQRDGTARVLAGRIPAIREHISTCFSAMPVHAGGAV